MKKIILLLILLFPLTVFAISLPETYSDKVLIYDLTEDKILLEKKSEERANIASLTKIMTTITAIEKNSDLSKEVTITDGMLAGIPWDASIAGIKKDEVYTVEELLYASILPSGADATQSLAITTSGSIKDFVKDMNELAKKIGVEGTHFVNVTGLDVENHYSSASDVLKILKYALNNETFKKVFCTKQYTLNNSKVVNSTLVTYNKMMGLDTSRILGSKTGYTSKSGVCIAALIKSLDHDILIITLGAPYVYGNFYNIRDALALTTFIDENFDYQSVVTKGDLVKSVPVELSKIEKYDVYAQDDVKKYLPSDYDKEKLKIVYDGQETISFRDIKGNTLGKLSYYYEDELIGEEKVVLNEHIEIDYGKFLKEYSVPLGIGIICLIIIIVLIKIIKKIRRRKRKKRR